MKNSFDFNSGGRTFKMISLFVLSLFPFTESAAQRIVENLIPGGGSGWLRWKMANKRM